MHQIETPEVECKDKLFDDDVKQLVMPEKPMGFALVWLSPELKSGFAYFTTAVPSRKMEQDQVVSTHARADPNGPSTKTD